MKQRQHPNTERVNREQQQASKEAKKLTFEWLIKTFPQTFFTDKENIRPLKLGIIDDILNYLSHCNQSSISRSKIRQSIQHYARRLPYLKQLQFEASRIDLQGREAGFVTEEEEELAIRKIKRALSRSKLRMRKDSAVDTNFYDEQSGIQSSFLEEGSN